MANENKLPTEPAKAAAESKSEIMIRPCRRTDADAIQRISLESFNHIDLKQHGSGIYVVSYGDTHIAELTTSSGDSSSGDGDGRKKSSVVAGYLVPGDWNISDNYGTVRIVLWIAVDPKYRRKGVAEALIREMIKETPESLYLVVRKSNTSAQALYKKLGFIEVDTFADFYNTTSATNSLGKEDALLLCCPK